MKRSSASPLSVAPKKLKPEKKEDRTPSPSAPITPLDHGVERLVIRPGLDRIYYARFISDARTRLEAQGKTVIGKPLMFDDGITLNWKIQTSERSTANNDLIEDNQASLNDGSLTQSTRVNNNIFNGTVEDTMDGACAGGSGSSAGPFYFKQVVRALREPSVGLHHSLRDVVGTLREPSVGFRNQSLRDVVETLCEPSAGSPRSPYRDGSEAETLHEPGTGFKNRYLRKEVVDTLRGPSSRFPTLGEVMKTSLEPLSEAYVRLHTPDQQWEPNSCTVVIKDLPYNLQSENLLTILNDNGFKPLAGFLRIAIRCKQNFSYAFVEFASQELAAEATRDLHDRNVIILGREMTLKVEMYILDPISTSSQTPPPPFTRPGDSDIAGSSAAVPRNQIQTTRTSDVEALYGDTKRHAQDSTSDEESDCSSDLDESEKDLDHGTPEATSSDDADVEIPEIFRSGVNKDAHYPNTCRSAHSKYRLKLQNTSSSTSTNTGTRHNRLPPKPLYKILSNSRHGSAATRNSLISPEVTSVPLPETKFGRARRILLPADSELPLAFLTMRADMQFVDRDERRRKNQYSLPHKSGEPECHVEDACAVNNTVVIGYDKGPYPLSLVLMEKGELPKLIDIKHQISNPKERSTDERIKCLTPHLGHDLWFYSGNKDGQIYLWKVDETNHSATTTRLPAAHGSAVQAITYCSHRQTIISSAGPRILSMDLDRPRKLEDALLSNHVHQIHLHPQDPNLVIAEVKHLDHQIQIWDLRTGGFEKLPCMQFGYRYSQKKYESSYSRGSADRFYFTRGYHDGTVCLWDYRNYKKVALKMQHQCSKPVVHAVFSTSNIVTYGGNMATFLPTTI